jgi:membrane protein
MEMKRRQCQFKEFVKKLVKAWNQNLVGDSAAALTYYGMLSLFPFLLFLVALTGLVLDPAATDNLVQTIARFAPPSVAQILGDRLKAIEQASSRKLLTIGIVGAVWAASGGVSSLMQALNRAYDVRETRPFWKTRGLAILVTLGAGVLGVLTAAIMFFVPVVGAIAGGRAGAALTWLRFPVAGAILMALLAVLYWILPNVKPRFHLITPGSVTAVVVWLAASWGFSEYVRRSRSYEATYGALGGVIILLVWMWLSAVVVLLGAELNKILTPRES